MAKSTKPDPMPNIKAEIDIIRDDVHQIARDVEQFATFSQKALNALASGVHILEDVTAQILNILMRDIQPTSVIFAVPSYFSNGKFLPMPTTIVDDVQSQIPLIFKNHVGKVVPMSADIVGSVVCDTPASFTAAMSPDGSAVLVDPVQPPVVGATGMLTYTGVRGNVTLTCQIELVTGADSIDSVEFDPTAITTAPLP